MVLHSLFKLLYEFIFISKTSLDHKRGCLTSQTLLCSRRAYKFVPHRCRITPSKAMRNSLEGHVGLAISEAKRICLEGYFLCEQLACRYVVQSIWAKMNS